MNLVETIKVLQKDVQSYKDDNERLMRSKAQQDDFNVKFLLVKGKGINVLGSICTSETH
jgi:hypothetical protein